jgi:hypothetical protein
MTDAATGQETTAAGEQGSADGQTATEATSLLTQNEPAKTETPDAQKTEPQAEKPAEEVDYTFELPEGVELDAKSMDEFKAMAKELKLPKEAAQKMVDLAAQREQSRIETHAKTVADWAESVKADKEIGGDKLAANLAVARKALELGPPELKDLLNASGLGNHPAVVKWALAVGKALSEDNFVPAGNPVDVQGSIASRLYSAT